MVLNNYSTSSSILSNHAVAAGMQPRVKGGNCSPKDAISLLTDAVMHTGPGSILILDRKRTLGSEKAVQKADNKIQKPTGLWYVNEGSPFHYKQFIKASSLPTPATNFPNGKQWLFGMAHCSIRETCKSNTVPIGNSRVQLWPYYLPGWVSFRW
ncbi:hypothetical protein AJ79_09562 [Helicocarpus griseus UAMH5409]|uniref:Uncharacterized protein n=1 Tax=Helicocarpus griseus UAMH5409 TaxID=1447875 RepID=A0A2B7WIN9_9EURO|nr:hypothetical protein AJ79_09562 [Helicocarpus griseus UAMH5409]